jgi:hypothetical protein
MAQTVGIVGAVDLAKSAKTFADKYAQGLSVEARRVYELDLVALLATSYESGQAVGKSLSQTTPPPLVSP